MALDLETVPRLPAATQSSWTCGDKAFSAAVEGLPKIVELITTVPEEIRPVALAAAQKNFLQTAQALGYEEIDAQQWASTVMSILEIAALAKERATQGRSRRPDDKGERALLR